MFAYAHAQFIPWLKRGAVGRNGHAALAFEHLKRVEREQASVPFGAAICGVCAALMGKITRGTVSCEGYGFERFVVEGNRFGRIERDALFKERFLHPHATNPPATIFSIPLTRTF